MLEAYVNGVSTRKVDRLVEQPGIDGMTKDRAPGVVPGVGLASRAVPPAAVGERLPVSVFDAKVVAYALHETGLREVIGLDIGEVEPGAFWTRVSALAQAGPAVGVRLALVSDQQEGLKAAIARVLSSTWQRCTVHYADVLVMPIRGV